MSARPTATINLINPGNGNPANATRTANGLLSLRSDLTAANTNLILQGMAVTPVDGRDPLIIDARRATQVRRVLANVAHVRAFHADLIAWVLAMHEEEDDDDDIDDDDGDERVAREAGSWIIMDLAKMDLLAETLQEELDRYDDSQRVWWATPGGVALLLAPVAGVLVLSVLGLRFRVLESAARWWRR